MSFTVKYKDSGPCYRHNPLRNKYLNGRLKTSFSMESLKKSVRELQTESDSFGAPFTFSNPERLIKQIMLIKQKEFEKGLEKWVYLSEGNKANIIEAAYRIKKAFYEKEECLDLSGLHLAALPKEIVLLTHLRELDLSENEFKEFSFSTHKLINLEVLNCSFCKNLKEIPHFLLLKELYCKGCSSLNRIVDLPSCVKLVCSLCIKLESIPTMTYCSHLECRGCDTLRRIPRLPTCRLLDCSSCDNLEFIPQLYLCKSLDCTYSRKIRELPSLPSCEILKCIGCSFLKELPPLPMCKYLNCNHCVKLTQLPALPECLELNCSGSLSLKKIPKLLNCKFLDCSFCRELEGIGALPKCLFLDSSFCLTLTILPRLPKCKVVKCINCLNLKNCLDLSGCEQLDCGGCKDLVGLPALPKCLSLDCRECTSIKVLPSLFLCEMLQCSWCVNLEQLPFLPSCIELYCSWCTTLELIPELPVCKEIDCAGCAQLTVIFSQPECLELDCSLCNYLIDIQEIDQCKEFSCLGCESITVLPDLPNCRVLDCSKCERLLELPLLPIHAEISADINERTISVEVEELENEPELILMSLYKHLATGVFPSITLLDENLEPMDGTDVGGLRRHLVTTLFDSLYRSTSRVGSLPFESEGDFYLPLLKNKEHLSLEKQTLCYQAIGCLFAFAQTQELLLGTDFKPDLFRAVLTCLKKSDLKVEPLKEEVKDLSLELKFILFSSLERQISSCINLLLKGGDLKKIVSKLTPVELGYLQGFLDPEFEKTDFKKWLSDQELNSILNSLLKEVNLYIDTHPTYQHALPAIAWIAHSMKEALAPEELQSILSLKVEEFQEQIEGDLTKELVKEVLVWEGVEHPSTKEYFLRWIDGAENESLKNLVKMVTGSATLCSTSHIYLSLYEADTEGRLPSSQTCAKQLNLPTNYRTYAHFKSQLEGSISAGLAAGFTLE